MRRPDHRLWALWLAALLLSPLALMALDVNPNEVPGEATPGPGWNASRLLDDAYYAAVGTWIQNESHLRGAGLRARYEVDYALLGDATSPTVAEGDTGGAFSRAWTDVDCTHIADIDPPETNGGFTWTVRIAKADWLADLLQPHDRPPSCTVEARAALRARMADDPTALDVNLAIDEDPATRSYRRDPHWNGEGRAAVAEVIMEHCQEGLWDPAAVAATEEELLQGFDRFLGLNETSTLRDLRVDRGVDVDHVSDQGYGLSLLVFQHSA